MENQRLTQEAKGRVSKAEAITAPVESKEVALETQLPATESPVVETIASAEVTPIVTSVYENSAETTSATEITDTSASTVSEAATSTPTNEQINDVLSEADKLIENAEAAVNSEAKTDTISEPATDSGVTNEIAPIENNDVATTGDNL